MMLLALAFVSALAASADTLGDDALVAYASQPYNKAEKFGTREILGVHHGAKVIAEFPCSDVCPNYTTRIIHYDVAPGPDCDTIGGLVRAQSVPISIAVMQKNFCVPKVLVEKKLF